MKKIMFNDKYGLTAAVLEGRKTMTRRLVPPRFYENILPGVFEEEIISKSYYKVGEVVAVAQAYKEIAENAYFASQCAANEESVSGMKYEEGWNNKMFVAAYYMPHHICITDIKVERLQDISDEDCLKEGLDWIIGTPGILKKWTFFGTKKTWNTRREAFAALIDKVSGKGTWENNPWVFAYSFELID